MNQIFYDAVGNNPIIAAVKNMKDIEVSCTIEDQWPESERSFGRISERTYGSRWHYINKAITDQESKRTWDVYDPQIFSVGFHGI